MKDGIVNGAVSMRKMYEGRLRWLEKKHRDAKTELKRNHADAKTDLEEKHGDSKKDLARILVAAKRELKDAVVGMEDVIAEGLKEALVEAVAQNRAELKKGNKELRKDMEKQIRDLKKQVADMKIMRAAEAARQLAQGDQEPGAQPSIFWSDSDWSSADDGIIWI